MCGWRIGFGAGGRTRHRTRGTLGRDLDLPAERSVEALRKRTHALLDAAYAAGVRYFDTARSYGRAEEFVGEWLAARSLAAAEVVVGSKWGYTSDLRLTRTSGARRPHPVHSSEVTSTVGTSDTTGRPAGSSPGAPVGTRSS